MAIKNLQPMMKHGGVSVMNATRVENLLQIMHMMHRAVYLDFTKKSLNYKGRKPSWRCVEMF